MLLTPTEFERLTIFSAAELARKRRARGRLLNYPEAVALIADELLEGARDGETVAALMSFGSTILTTADVMPGVAAMATMLQVECVFPDGTKLVTLHDPIRPAEGAPEQGPPPGEIIPGAGTITLSAGRRRTSLTITNTGDRPVQVGSHFHIFEANKALDFDRAAGFGMRLDIPAGTAVRFEPGQSRAVTLVAFGGSGVVTGLNSLTEGPTGDAERPAAVARAAARGFKGA